MKIIVLDTTTKTICAALSSAVATSNPDFVVAYADTSDNTFSELSSDGQLNGTTDVTLVGAPASGVKRAIKSITIYNRDTAAVTVSIKFDNGGTQRILQRVQLVSGETWHSDELTKLSPGGSDTQVQFNDTGTLAGSSNFTYNKTTSVLTLGANPVLTAGTANGILYLNGSKVATSGSALNFDGTTLGIGTSTFTAGSKLSVQTTAGKWEVIAEGSSSVRLKNGGGLTLESGSDFYFNFGASEIMRLNSAGNLGLGVTPSVWYDPANYRAVQIGQSSFVGRLSSGAEYTQILSNVFVNSTGAYKYINNGTATVYEMLNGSFRWSQAASGTAGNTATFTQAMTLDANGNLVVGFTSGNYRLTAARAAGGTQLAVTTATANGSNASPLNIDIDFLGYNDETKARIRASDTSANTSESPLAFWTKNSAGTLAERARITSGGYFKASNTGTYQSSTSSYHELRNDANANTVRITNTIASGYTDAVAQITITGYSPNTTNSWFLFCNDSVATRAEIRSNGGIANYSANDVNLSDRREKTNFAPAKSYLETICAIPVQTFNYIDQSEDDPGLTLGVVAQDVQAVAPELVMESNWGTEENPKMRLSIYQTDLQYALMKCIQEQQALITSLTARVAALEGTQP